MPQDQFAVVWEILEGKAAAAGACSLAGGMISISSLPLEAASGLDAALDLPAIDPPSRLRSSLSPPHPADQLHSLFTLFSTCKRAAPLLTDQYYFSSQPIQPPAGTAIMPGPLRERDPNISSSRRSSVQFLESLRPKSHLSHQRLPDQEVLSADESEENIEPRFMTSTAASSSRSIASSTPPSAPPKPRRTPTPHSLLTLGALASKSISGEHPNDEGASSPQGTNGTHVASLDRDSLPATHPARDKPLPSRPIAHVVTSSPYKEARTLIDASEKPLRRSPGSPDEEDWPALFPTQPSTPGTLQAFSRCHPARSSNEAYVTTHMAMDAPLNDTPASRDEQRPTIKMVAQNSSDNILPSSQKAEKASPSVAPTTDNHTASTLSSPRKKENATDNTTPTSLAQPKPRLIDIHSPKSRQGRRPPRYTQHIPATPL
ncbi:proteophosphoglycan 5 [Neofusicoccum parvum]|uniref:Proteophosphoglycan 5 n=1 Tax=Neofusicoccum parvum TaxID=310453 RepID=A0ACB5RWH5_9PEZI|nr:proteophosphoglycan 5 [Neofusicoccum parvum]